MGQAFGLAVMTWIKMSHPTVEPLGSGPSSGSCLQQELAGVRAQRIGSLLPSGRPELSSSVLAFALWTSVSTCQVDISPTHVKTAFR